MEEVRLAAGYEWSVETRDMGDAVLSLRDGQENVIWVEMLPNVDGHGVAITLPPVPGPVPPMVELTADEADGETGRDSG
jgi:hypothetical protein